jgi:hypothetical protein
MLQIQGIKGEAVLGYCEPLITQEMRHHTAFPMGKKTGPFLSSEDFTFCEFLKTLRFFLNPGMAIELYSHRPYFLCNVRVRLTAVSSQQKIFLYLEYPYRVGMST